MSTGIVVSGQRYRDLDPAAPGDAIVAAAGRSVRALPLIPG